MYTLLALYAWFLLVAEMAVASTSLQTNVKKRKLPGWATSAHVTNHSSTPHLQHRSANSLQHRRLSCDRSGEPPTCTTERKL